jgi:hypothetical protein
MPEAKTVRRARNDARAGKKPSTQAGEFVKEEMDHIRAGKHGARSTKQAIAIGLSKARRAGVKLAAPKKGTTSAATRKKAKVDTAASKKPRRTSATRSRATTEALEKEPRAAASHRAIATQSRTAAKRRGTTGRKRAASTRRRKGGARKSG